MKKLSAILILLILSGRFMYAQVGFNTDNSAPESSAMLDVKSTSKGVLLPRMTMVQISAIQNPSNGLTVYCTTDDKYYVYNSLSLQWKAVSKGLFALGQPFPCGTTLTVNHVTGDVAPVTKTVKYGTLTGIPGTGLKCWLASNLGADRQATSQTDTSEAAAGWYWQFNRKQGYRYYGTVRTPNTPWISPINENSDWVEANDPCSIELGSPWRIPTATELTDFYNSTALPGTWSWLKFHYGGALYYNSGTLSGRGLSGYFWSNTQSVYDFSDGIALILYTDPFILCGMFAAGKSGGFSIRCIRD